MPSNKKKGRSTKKAAKDDRKAEKERKKIEAQLIHKPCPNGRRCADPKCRHVHVCPDALEMLAKISVSRAVSAERMSAEAAEAQETLAVARHRLIQQMIKDGGHDFRFCVCFGHECEKTINIPGLSRGTANIREKVDACYCAKCDRTFCPSCIAICKGCNVHLCYGCEPFLEYTFVDSKGAVGELLRVVEGHCTSCSFVRLPKMIQALGDTKYRTLMREMYSKFPSCAYCANHLPNGPDTKRCGDCSAVRYCDEICQEMDWSGKHREYCQVLRQDRNDRLAKWYQKHQPKLEVEAGLWDIE